MLSPNFADLDGLFLIRSDCLSPDQTHYVDVLNEFILIKFDIKNYCLMYTVQFIQFILQFLMKQMGLINKVNKVSLKV